MKTRHFEFVGGSSAKFWEVTTGDDHRVTVRFGRLGTQGQSQTRPFADADEAKQHVDKLIASKRKKGYVETVTA